MTVLVTGGAGYIGSVFVEHLLARGERPVVLDDLSHGHRDAVDPSVPFYTGCVGDRALVTRIAREHAIDACVHYAGDTSVSDSVADPAHYYDRNVTRAVTLFDALVKCGVGRFVYSSSASVYGTPAVTPIDEDQPLRPISPYGRTKLIVEQFLGDLDRAHATRHVSFRYFNAAGCTPARGERHTPETHLIPNVLRAARGESGAITVFGDDHATPDGTAIRDYIHVSDLADAHARALTHLRDGGPSHALNLGTGAGHSVLDVIESARRVTGCMIPIVRAPRRAGDPAKLVARVERVREVLGWEARYTSLDAIIETAWAWERSRGGRVGR
jgi:UDP-glucose 4-epimerase